MYTIDFMRKRISWLNLNISVFSFSSVQCITLPIKKSGLVLQATY